MCSPDGCGCYVQVPLTQTVWTVKPCWLTWLRLHRSSKDIRPTIVSGEILARKHMLAQINKKILGSLTFWSHIFSGTLCACTCTHTYAHRTIGFGLIFTCMNCAENWGIKRDKEEEGKWRRQNVTIFACLNYNNITELVFTYIWQLRKGEAVSSAKTHRDSNR